MDQLKKLRDVTCLSMWFPRIRDVVPVPQTIILNVDQVSLSCVLDGNKVPEFVRLGDMIQAARESLGGGNVFLRTGHTSGKHRWLKTCFIPASASRAVIGHNVYELIEFSETVDMLGLPYAVWAVREYLPVTPLFRMCAYSGMPFVREFRCFVVDGKCERIVPYWPEGAVEEGEPDDPDWSLKLEISDTLSLQDSSNLKDLSGVAGRACVSLHNRWSVDIIETRRGWVVTDMAAAELSYGWKAVRDRRESEDE